MKILGLDPGLGITGYGIIDFDGGCVTLIEAGVVRSAEKAPMAERLEKLHHEVAESLDEHRPEAVAVEQIYSHYAHPRTAILMGHARGVLLLAAAGRGIGVTNYASTRIKRSLTGNGHASKLQMQRMIQSTLDLPEMPDPPDVADALAVALCHANALRGIEGGRTRGRR